MIEVTTKWDWLGDPLALDVANTVRRRGWVDQELWVTGTDVATWTELERDRLAPVTAREADDRLWELHQLRDAIMRLLRSTTAAAPWSSKDVDLINQHIRTHAIVPQLDPGRDGVIHRPLNAVTDQSGRVDLLLGQMATAPLAFLEGPDRQLLALCDAPSCGQLFLRRRSNQHWCCTACGTRARVARHAQRNTP